MLALLDVILQRVDDYAKMRFVAEKVGVADVYEQRTNIVVADILGISFLDIVQVFVGDGLFIRPVPLADIGLQFGYRCMKIDQEVGLNELCIQDLEQLLIELVFLIREIDLGKQQTFGEQVVGDRQGLKKIAGVDQFIKLLIAFGHKEQLQRKRILGGILIEFRQEGVIGELFQDQPGIVMSGQHMCQSGLSRADIPFYRNEMLGHVYLFTSSWSVQASSNSRTDRPRTGWI